MLEPAAQAFAGALVRSGAGGAAWPVALLLVVRGAIALLAVLLTPETRARDLDDRLRQEPAGSGAVI